MINPVERTGKIRRARCVGSDKDEKPFRVSERSVSAAKYNPHKGRERRRYQSGLFNKSRVVGFATTQLSGFGSFLFLFSCDK